MIHRRTLLAAPAIVFASSLMLNGRARGQSLDKNAWNRPRAPDDLIAGFVDQKSRERAQPIMDRHNARLLRAFGRGVFQYRVVRDDVVALAVELSESGLVRYVEPDSQGTLPAIPNDPLFTNGSPTPSNSQLHLTNMNCQQAWNTFKLTSMPISGAGAMPPLIDLDTGTTPAHPDLAANILPGWSIINNSTDVTDQGFHGTFISGLVAAATNNATGMASIGWGGSLIPVQATVANAIFASFEEAALQWVLANVTPPGVILMEWANAAPLNITLTSTLPALWAAGFFLVGPSGDTGTSNPLTGCINSDYVLCATAVAGSGATPYARPTYADYGPPAVGGRGAIVAPPGGDTGAEMLSAAPGGGYSINAGTSASAAVLAATARYLMATSKFFNVPLTLGNLWYILTNPANGHATTGFGAGAVPWSAPPMPLLDKCLSAVLAGQVSPYAGVRVGRR